MRTTKPKLIEFRNSREVSTYSNGLASRAFIIDDAESRTHTAAKEENERNKRSPFRKPRIGLHGKAQLRSKHTFDDDLWTGTSIDRSRACEHFELCEEEWSRSSELLGLGWMTCGWWNRWSTECGWYRCWSSSNVLSIFKVESIGYLYATRFLWNCYPWRMKFLNFNCFKKIFNSHSLLLKTCHGFVPTSDHWKPNVTSRIGRSYLLFKAYIWRQKEYSKSSDLGIFLQSRNTCNCKLHVFHLKVETMNVKYKEIPI